jgi:hypothetical protein
MALERAVESSLSQLAELIEALRRSGDSAGVVSAAQSLSRAFAHLATLDLMISPRGTEDPATTPQVSQARARYRTCWADAVQAAADLCKAAPDRPLSFRCAAIDSLVELIPMASCEAEAYTPIATIVASLASELSRKKSKEDDSSTATTTDAKKFLVHFAKTHLPSYADLYRVWLSALS